MIIRTLTSAALLGFASLAAAQEPPGTPAKAGKATLIIGGKPTQYDKVQGSFSEGYGFLTVGTVFGGATSDNLQVNVMVKGPGKVDLNQPAGNGFGIRKGGTIYMYEKGKSQCTLTLTKVSAKEIEGTAECPRLNELNGPGVESVTGVKFSATAG